MDIEEIKAFVKAGYSKEDIEALEHMGGNGAEGQAAGNESAGNESAGNESAGAESAAGAGAESVNTDAAIKALTETVNALTATVKAMQDNNVSNATGGKPEKSSVEETLKSFIDTL